MASAATFDRNWLHAVVSTLAASIGHWGRLERETTRDVGSANLIPLATM